MHFILIVYYWIAFLFFFPTNVLFWHNYICLIWWADQRVLNQYDKVQSFSAFSHIYNHSAIFGIQATTVSYHPEPSSVYMVKENIFYIWQLVRNFFFFFSSNLSILLANYLFCNMQSICFLYLLSFNMWILRGEKERKNDEKIWL